MKPEMIRRVFRLNDMKSINIMTPRVALTHLTGGYDHCRRSGQNPQLPTQPQFWLPDADVDHILGICAQKTNFWQRWIRGEGNQPLRNVVRPVPLCV